jgi:hypothetical protein
MRRGSVVAFARRNDPDTSHAAAADITLKLRELQCAVLRYAADQSKRGFTDLEMIAHFGTTSSTYRTRRSELVAKGLVHDTGERRAAGEGGRKHAVWATTLQGENTLAAIRLDQAA